MALSLIKGSSPGKLGRLQQGRKGTKLGRHQRGFRQQLFLGWLGNPTEMAPSTQFLSLPFTDKIQKHNNY